MLAPSPAPGLLGQAHLDPRRRGLLALAASRDADDRAHADAWRRRVLRQQWRRHRGEEEARERYREGLIGAFAAGDAEGLLPGAARGSSAGGAGFDLGNIGRGIGERAGDLGGGLLGAVNAAAGYLERRLPLGGIDLERGLYGPGAPPARNLGRVAARRLKDLDLGYAPGTTWEEVKRSPASRAIAFAVEQGLVSLPDMAAALASLPAYVLARTGELADARAEADLRKDATVGDLVAALPGAAASALLERLGARRILGIGDALGSRSVRGVAGAAGRGSAVEGGTETGQEGIEHLTSRLGTATGMDAHEMADAMMAGGVAGAIFGGGVRAATATGEALLGRPRARKAGAGTRAAPSVAPPPASAEPRRTQVPVGAPGRGKPTPPSVAENIKWGRIAMERAIASKADQARAMYRPELQVFDDPDTGWIDFVWSTPKGGGGIGHLIERRAAESIDGRAFARKLPEIVAEGQVGPWYVLAHDPTPRRNIVAPEGTAVISPVLDRARLNWVVTGFPGQRLLPAQATTVSQEEAEGALSDELGRRGTAPHQPTPFTAMPAHGEGGAESGRTLFQPSSDVNGKPKVGPRSA